MSPFLKFLRLIRERFIDADTYQNATKYNIPRARRTKKKIRRRTDDLHDKRRGTTTKGPSAVNEEAIDQSGRFDRDLSPKEREQFRDRRSRFDRDRRSDTFERGRN